MTRFRRALFSAFLVLSACQTHEAVTEGELHPIQQDFTHQIQAEGQIKPVITESINVPRRLFGTLETLVPEGTQVKAGQVVASINTRAFQERIGRYSERFEQEQGRLLETQAGLPLEQLKLQADIAEKARQQQQQALELQALIAGPRLDERVSARVNKEIAALKAEQFPISQKQQLYEKGYLSEQELQQAQQELLTYQTQQKTADLSLKQQTKGYRQPDIALEQLKNKSLKLDTQIAKLSAQAQQSLLKTQAQNQASRMRSTQKRFNSFQDRIATSELKAPFDGTVLYPRLFGNEKPHIGMEVFNGLAVVEVAQTDQLMVRSRVDEFSIPYVKEGQKVNLTSPGFPDRVFTGKVAKIHQLAKYKDETKPVGLKYFDIDIALDGFDPLPREMRGSGKGRRPGGPGGKGGAGGKNRRTGGGRPPQADGAPSSDRQQANPPAPAQASSSSSSPGPDTGNVAGAAQSSAPALSSPQAQRESGQKNTPAAQNRRQQRRQKQAEAAKAQPELALLKANMKVDVAIQVQNLPKAWLVPLEALVEKDQKSFLRLRENGQVIERPVEVLGRSENMAALKGNFTGQEILVLGAKS